MQIALVYQVPCWFVRAGSKVFVRALQLNWCMKLTLLIPSSGVHVKGSHSLVR